MKKIAFAFMALVASPAFGQTVGVHRTSPPVLTDGVQQQFLLDTNGSLVTVSVPASSPATGTLPNASTAVSGAVVGKASAGALYGVNVTAGATAGFVMVFNATSAPADGAVTPSRCIPLAANTGIELNYRSIPVYFGTGITVVFSSTGCFTKTTSATAFISVDVK